MELLVFNLCLLAALRAWEQQQGSGPSSKESSLRGSPVSEWTPESRAQPGKQPGFAVGPGKRRASAWGE